MSLEFAHLVLPGDYLGVENLVGLHSNIAVRAITPARLMPVTVLNDEQRIQILTDAFIQGHRRCREVLNLRTGESIVRITRLIHLLSESVCRVLSNLRQAEQLQPRVPRPRTRRRTQVMAARGTPANQQPSTHP